MNDDRTSPWIRACKTEDLKNSNPLDFDYEDKKILITNVDNRIYATDRICTHAYADLSTGFLNESEKTVTCPAYVYLRFRKWKTSKFTGRGAMQNL